MQTRATLLAVFVALSVVATPAGAVPTDESAPASNADRLECTYPVEVTDATGTTVTIESEPKSVVTLAPSAAQTMWEIGAKDKVVGVSKYAYYLDGAREKANVSAPGFGNYNTERIVSLDPDLVLAPNVIPNQAVEQIRSAGVKVVKFAESKSIEDIRKKTQLIGQLVGECEGTEEAVDWMDRNLNAVQKAVGDAGRPKVLYLSGRFTVGGNTFINDMILEAGGDNIAAEAGVRGYAQISAEIVADRNPTWIVTTTPNASILQTAPYNRSTAVTEGNVVSIDPNYVSQPAPRSVVYAVRNMTAAFHPEKYGESYYVSRAAVEGGSQTPTPTPTTTADDGSDGSDGGDGVGSFTVGSGDDGGDGSDGSGQGLPGFGPVVAVIAVALAVVSLVRRRD